MSQQLTLSVVIPKNKINRSLALSLVDLDSHFSSLRYSSLEFLIVHEEEDSFNDDMINIFNELLPSVKAVSSLEVNDHIKGENIILINNDNIDLDLLDKLTDFIKKDTPIVFVSHEPQESFVEKSSLLLEKNIKLDKPVRINTYPHFSFFKKEVVGDYLSLSPHHLVITTELSEYDVEVLEYDKLSGPGILHYIKLWFNIFKIKLINIFNQFILFIKRKINIKKHV